MSIEYVTPERTALIPQHKVSLRYRVELDQQELHQMAFEAWKNKGKVAKAGPLRVVITEEKSFGLGSMLSKEEKK